MYSAEEWGDCGIISQLDLELSYDINLDAYGVLLALYEESSTAVKEIFMKIPAGEHFISFKYIKDDNYNSGNDSFKVRAVRAVETTVSEEGASLTLMNGSAILSATDITFEGYVTFKSLSEPGSTVINGANIMTGTLSADMIDTNDLRVQEVWYYDETDGYFSVMSSEISEQNTVTRIGPKDIRNDYMQAMEVYGTGIWFVRPGYTASNDGRALLFDMEAREIIPATDDTWDIGTDANSFNSIYLNTGVYLYDDDASDWTRLYVYNGSLVWRDVDGTRHTIV